MFNRRRVLKPDTIRFQTSMANLMAEEAVEAAHAFEADSEQEKRLAALECRRCFYFYRGRVGGAAMTTWHCGVCNTPAIYGSTATPVACRGCAEKHHLCTCCGGDLSMRKDRREFPEIVPESGDAP